MFIHEKFKFDLRSIFDINRLAMNYAMCLLSHYEIYFLSNILKIIYHAIM